MRKFTGLLFFLAAVLLPGRADAATAYCPSTTDCTLTFDTSGPNYGAGPFGTINFLLVGSVINVTVDLAGNQATGFHMIENGSHIAFGLNVNNDTALGVVGQVSLSSITAGYTQVANNGSVPSVSPPAQGTYRVSLTSDCGNGSGCGQNVVTFTASRVGGFTDVNQLIFPNSDGYFATADVARNGVTGPIFSTLTDTSITINGNVPEPSSVFLIGLGLAGIGFLRRKRHT